MWQRLSIGLESLDQVADRVVDEEETALVLNVKRRGASALLKERPHILHELIEKEVDADGALEHF